VVLESTGKTADLHIKHLSLIPKHLSEKLESLGVKVYINNDKTIPDMDEMSDLKGVRPRGWDEGMTWDIVPGAYDPRKKYVLAGHGDHGSCSAVLHEYGHAIGHLMQLDNSPQLISIHSKNYAKLPKYLRQDGPGGQAGRQELLAEGFAEVLIDRRMAVIYYGSEFVEWVEKTILKI
jgi:hypothetical protein